MKQFAKWPCFSEEEANLVAAVLKSNAVNYWNGEEGKAFEREFAEYHRVPHGIALANGTLALELAIRALEIPEGSEIIVTPRSFVASASSIAMCGCRPVFADVDRDTQNISVEHIAKALTERTRAIVAVHLAGWPCPMREILEFAKQRGLVVIEDCAQAHGARIEDDRVGSFGDAAAFSFCTDKIISTGGEGGMLLVKDDAAFDRAWSFKDHGKSREAVYKKSHPPGFRWLHESLGTNWRLTEMQSALGRYQLRKLEEWLVSRRRNAQRIAEACLGFDGLRTPLPPRDVHHAYYKFYTFVRPRRLRKSWDRDRIAEELGAQGVPVMHGSCSEIYLEKGMRTAGFGPVERLPNARELGETSLMFPVHPTLTEEDIAFVCRKIEDVMKQASL